MRRPGLPGRNHCRRSRKRPAQIPRGHRRGRMRGKGERGDHAQVPATAAAAGPEQVGVGGVAHRAHSAVGGHDLQFGERVAGQAVGTDQNPDAAAEGESGDADGGARACGQRAARTAHGRVHLRQRRAGPHARRTVVAHRDRRHPTRVDDEGRRNAGPLRSASRPAGIVVPARAHREWDVVLGREREPGGDVGCGCRDEDGERHRAVVARVLDPAGRVVCAVSGDKQRAVQPGGKPRPVGRAGGRRGRLVRRGRRWCGRLPCAAAEQQSRPAQAQELATRKFGHRSWYKPRAGEGKRPYS